MSNTDKYIDERGRINFDALYEGAEREREARAKERKEHWEKQRAIQEAEDRKNQEFMEKVAKSIADENKAKADREIAEAKAKAEQDIEAELYKKNGVKVETKVDKALKSLLGGLNLDDMD